VDLDAPQHRPSRPIRGWAPENHDRRGRRYFAGREMDFEHAGRPIASDDLQLVWSDQTAGLTIRRQVDATEASQPRTCQ
jgi:hypothetical protein